MGLFPLPFDELHADAPTMRDAATLLAHAEADGWPQLWLHSDGRALVVTRVHRYVPTPEALATLRQKFEDSPRKDGAVSVYRLRDAKATEPNNLVSAERAQKLLDGAQHGPYMVAPDGDEAWLVTDLADADVATVFRNGDDPAVDRGNADLLAASWSLGETVVAQHAEIERLTRERDRAVAKAQQFARVLAGAATVEDAVQLLSAALVEDASSAPNCAEWRGSYGERAFAITVQWVDGKSPHALIDEARRERDALRAELATVTAALDSKRLRAAAVPGALQAAMEALVPLASKAYRCCVGGIEPVDAPVTRATGGARDRPRLCLARDLSVDNPRPWQAWLAGCDEALVTGASGDDHATADAALADLREALEQAAGPPPVRWGDEGTMDHDADDDTEGGACG